MNTHYTLLDIPAHATAEEIETAYRRQRERYSPERVAELGPEFRRIAEQRLAELDSAYTVLSDAARRRSYDASVGLGAGKSQSVTAEDMPGAAGRPGPSGVRRAGLSRREILMAAGGALIGLLVIAAVWVLSGQRAEASLPPAAQQNRPAPEIALPALDSGMVRLSDYRGKVVLLNFWYTGCAPCREETPALQAAYSKLAGQGLQIIGVNVRLNERAGADGDADIRKFVGEFGVTYPIALDVESKADRAYQIYVLPTSVMIDRNGQIRYLMFSAVSTKDVEALFHKLQQETTAVSSQQ